MNKNITARNKRNQLHGLFKLYYANNQPSIIGRAYEDKPIGCWILYEENGELKSKTFYIL